MKSWVTNSNQLQNGTRLKNTHTNVLLRIRLPYRRLLPLSKLTWVNVTHWMGQWFALKLSSQYGSHWPTEWVTLTSIFGHNDHLRWGYFDLFKGHIDLLDRSMWTTFGQCDPLDGHRYVTNNSCQTSSIRGRLYSHACYHWGAVKQRECNISWRFFWKELVMKMSFWICSLKRS